MRKRISFFNVFYIITITISSLMFVGLLVMTIVSYITLNHSNETIYYNTDIEILNSSDVKKFNAYYNDKNLFILVSFYEKKTRFISLKLWILLSSKV